MLRLRGGCDLLWDRHSACRGCWLFGKGMAGWKPIPRLKQGFRDSRWYRFRLSD
jgi:hypothetical protein